MSSSRPRMRAPAAQLAPITRTDVAAVADFLHDHHDGHVPWADAMTATWNVAAPNLGYLLRDGGQCVGAVLALYSERLIGGRLERFCNIGTWCVAESYRAQSLALISAVLNQDGYHFTVLSPNEGPQEILPWLKFRFLDTAAVLVPNLPWPTVPGRSRISDDPAFIGRTLVGSELALYRDHAHTLAARHLIVTSGGETCYVMYREFRFKGTTGYAMVLHVGNLDLFDRCLAQLTRHFLLRRGLVATLAEFRTIGRATKPARLSMALNNRPKLYRSAYLQPGQIDYLYSELMCVPW